MARPLPIAFFRPEGRPATAIGGLKIGELEVERMRLPDDSPR